jgi:hypothetical protein
MSADDKLDLNRLLGMPAQSGPADPLGQVPILLPLSGLVCPKCGTEAHLMPDGKPEGSGWWSNPKSGEILSPYYHLPCIIETLAERDFTYLAEHLKPWTPRAELEREGGADAGSE